MIYLAQRDLARPSLVIIDPCSINDIHKSNIYNPCFFIFFKTAKSLIVENSCSPLNALHSCFKRKGAKKVKNNRKVNKEPTKPKVVIFLLPI